MKTEYPYYVSAKVYSGQLLKIFKTKKYKTYTDCYFDLIRWKNICKEGQFVILEYTSNYECKIVTIITDNIETNLV